MEAPGNGLLVQSHLDTYPYFIVTFKGDIKIWSFQILKVKRIKLPIYKIKGHNFTMILIWLKENSFGCLFSIK